MDNILFRGKRIDNAEWIFGLVTEQTKRQKCGKVLTKIKSKQFGVGEHLVDTKTVGQFIGLFDCKDKPIYDKDIVEVYGDYYIVKKECDRLGGYWAETGWVLEQIGVDFIMCFSDTIDEYSNMISAQVVGNVYDNKDLLETRYKQ